MIPVIITASKEKLNKLCDAIYDRVENNEWDGYNLTEEDITAFRSIQLQIEKQLDESKDNVCPLLQKKNY